MQERLMHWHQPPLSHNISVFYAVHALPVIDQHIGTDTKSQAVYKNPLDVTEIIRPLHILTVSCVTAAGTARISAIGAAVSAITAAGTAAAAVSSTGTAATEISA